MLLMAALFAALVALITWQLAARLLPGLAMDAPAPVTTADAGASRALRAALASAAWLDGHALSTAALAGHACVLCAFADTDPRALVALPVLEAWQAAYGSAYGVRVVAMHSPAFGFGADTSVTGRFVRRLALTLPVALDPDGRLAASLGGIVAGPRVLVADSSGRVISDTVGTLQSAQAALAALAARLRPDLPPPPAIGAALPARVRLLRLGASQVQEGPLAALPAGHEQVFSAEFRYQEQGRADVPYPIGAWRMGVDGVTATRGGAAEVLSIRYSAGRAGVVMSPPASGPVRVWVLHDEHWPRAVDRDEDEETDGRGAAFVTVRESRLYWIDRGRGERVLKLSPDQPGLTVHAFVATGAGPQ